MEKLSQYPDFTSHDIRLFRLDAGHDRQYYIAKTFEGVKNTCGNGTDEKIFWRRKRIACI